jgi:hypothetical protein
MFFEVTCVLKVIFIAECTLDKKTNEKSNSDWSERVLLGILGSKVRENINEGRQSDAL